MDDRVKRFRSAARELGGSGRGRRYPPELRDLAVSMCLDAQADGEKLRSVASALGVSDGTLERWLGSTRHQSWQGGLQEVVLAEHEEAPSLSVVTPGGYRVEGLSLSEVTTLLRSLR